MYKCLGRLLRVSVLHGRSLPFLSTGAVPVPDCEAIVAKKPLVRQSRRIQSEIVFFEAGKSTKKAPETGAGKDGKYEKDCRNVVQTNTFASGTKPL